MSRVKLKDCGKLSSIEEYIERGDAYDSKGEFDLAIADYSEALRLDPDNETAKNALAGLNGA